MPHNLLNRLTNCRCLLCKQSTTYRQPICNFCHTALSFHGPICSYCQLPLPEQHSLQICGNCLTHPPPYRQLLAIGHYQHELAKMITAYKYRGNRAYGDTLCKMWLKMNQPQLNTYPELIVSVPLSLKRRMLRGFNQSSYLAVRLSKALAVPYTTSLFRRNGDAAQMVGLGKAERHRQARKQYQLKQLPQVKHLAIVDDVVTTGATVNTLCRLLLREMPDLTIDIWCLARTPS